jgi:DNA-directed RNA polymerase I, II, and III subunit RPABC1
VKLKNSFNILVLDFDEMVDVQVLRKSFITVCEMLHDRNYEIPPDKITGIDDFDQFAPDYRKNMTENFICTRKDSKLSVIWNESMGISDVKQIHESMHESLNGVTHVIVIHKDKITPHASNAIKTLRTQSIIFEVFYENDLQINVTKNELVPRHIICSKKTLDQVLKDYCVTKNQLPQIMITDPICKYYGAKKGQLIKIIRPSDSIPEIEINGEKKELYDISYRIVV